MTTDLELPRSDRSFLPRTLDYLPVGLFGSVLALLALGAAWTLAHALFGAPVWLGRAIDILALIDFIALSIAYLVKMATSFDAVVAEFEHPVAGALFGLPPICLLLIPTIFAQWSLPWARAIWIAGAVTTAAFGWLIVTRWIDRQQQLLYVTPAWAIPAVGFIEIPLAVPALDLPAMPGLMIACLSLGIFFIIPIFTMVFSRLIFEPPLPDPLKPTVLLLAAPFSVASSAYAITTGRTDALTESFVVIALFLLAILVGRLRHLAQCCPFKTTWWATGFPFASAAVSTIRYAIHAPSLPASAVSLLLLGAATIMIAALLARTLYGIARGELRLLAG